MPQRSIHPDARQMLDQIDAFLLRNDDASEDLAAVLTALRGPDFPSDDKARTTIPIRRAAFPRCAHYHGSIHVGRGGRRFLAMEPITKYSSYGISTDFRHFKSHADLAAEALGLIDTPSVLLR